VSQYFHCRRHPVIELVYVHVFRHIRHSHHYHIHSILQEDSGLCLEHLILVGRGIFHSSISNHDPEQDDAKDHPNEWVGQVDGQSVDRVVYLSK